MPATKRGIYHNLKESKYSISNGEIEYFFSSQLYREKFLKEYKNNRNEFDNKFNSIVTNNTMNFSDLADCHLYRIIEKRGFRVRRRGSDLSWQELCQYALENLTKKNIKDWRKTPKQK